MDLIILSTAADFRQAAGSFPEQRLACCRYFKRGRDAGLSTSELVDLLGVSAPSILEKAGYSDADAQRVMELLADLSDDEIEQADKPA